MAKKQAQAKSQDKAFNLNAFLTDNGFANGKKSTTRIVDKPTIEFYRGGGVRIRGVSGLLRSAAIYKVTDNGIVFIFSDDREGMKKTASEIKARIHAPEINKGGVPNIKFSGSKRFFEKLEEINAEKYCDYSASKAHAHDDITVEVKGDTKVITYNLPEQKQKQKQNKK